MLRQRAQSKAAFAATLEEEFKRKEADLVAQLALAEERHLEEVWARFSHCCCLRCRVLLPCVCALWFAARQVFQQLCCELVVWVLQLQMVSSNSKKLLETATMEMTMIPDILREQTKVCESDWAVISSDSWQMLRRGHFTSPRCAERNASL